jgi:hypothetical protein
MVRQYGNQDMITHHEVGFYLELTKVNILTTDNDKKESISETKLNVSLKLGSEEILVILRLQFTHYFLYES